MNRTQFTFYESFYSAISRIKKKADQAEAYSVLCQYALYGTEPDMDRLPDAVAVVFEMVKPNLIASRRKAESGKKGGAHKQTEANAKQTASKPKQTKEPRKQEKEQVQEKEQEQDKEQMLSPQPPLPWASAALQAAFSDWLAYKKERREGYKETGLRNLETEVRNNAQRYGEQAVAELIRTCMARGWSGIIFERLKEKPQAQGRDGNVFLQMLEEERKG